MESDKQDKKMDLHFGQNMRKTLEMRIVTGSDVTREEEQRVTPTRVPGTPQVPGVDS